MFYCGCTLCQSAVSWNIPTWQLSVCNNEPFWRTAAGRVAPWCAATDDLVNGTDDTADEIMERIVRSATQGPSQRTQPRERRRSRVNRKSREWRPADSLACTDANNTEQFLQLERESLIVFFLLPLPVCNSTEDAEERFDDRGGQRSRPVQWFWDAGVKLDLWTPWKLLPWPAWQPSALWPVAMSWARLYWFGSYRASWWEWSLFMSWQGSRRTGAPRSTFNLCRIDVDLHSRKLHRNHPSKETLQTIANAKTVL